MLLGSKRRIDFPAYYLTRGGTRSQRHRLGLATNRASVKRRGLKRISKRSRSAVSSHSAVWSRRETLARAVLQPQTLLENWLSLRPRGYQDEVGQKPSSSRPVGAQRRDRTFSDRDGVACRDCSAPSSWLR